VRGTLHHQLGFVGGRAPRAAAFRAGLEAEMHRLREFLGLRP
jgi:hypothetical protein